MKLKQIQERVAEALGRVGSLAGVDVVVEDRGDVKSALDAAIGRANRCILVQTPGFRVTSKASKVMVGIATVVVQAMDRLVVARASGRTLTAQDMAEIAAWELNMMPVEGAGVLAVKEITSTMLGDTTLSYSAVLEVQAALGDPLDKGKEEAV